MSLFGRLYRGETSFDFVGARRTFLIISSILLVVSALSLAIRGLNLSLDFRGGVAVETENPANAAVAEVREALAPLGLSDARIQLLADGQDLRVQTQALDAEQTDELVRAVAAVAGTEVIDTSVDEVGPTFGVQIAERALLALVVFLGAAILNLNHALITSEVLFEALAARHPVDEVNQDVEDLVVAGQPVGRGGCAVTGHVRVDAAPAGAVTRAGARGEDRLVGVGHEPMLHRKAVKQHDGTSLADLFVVDGDAAA